MYQITFVHKDETEERTLYLPGDNDYCLTAAALSLEVGAAGELSVSIPDTNPAKADFVCLTDEIIVYRDGAELWRGRAITRQEDFYKTGTLTCEGVLAYLYDTYYPPFEFSGSPTDFLQSVLDNHNAQVEERKQFHLGTVTVEDSNDYIARSSIEYNRTLTVLTDKLINDSLGGYFRVRIVDGVKYLDYLDSYGTTATQPVEFGVNLLDIAQNVEYSDLATVILPLGAKLEDSDGNQTDEYLTISSINGGSIYYADEAAVAEYGWIVVCNIWEDVTEASNLLTKAKNYLAQVTSAVSSFEVSAVDLALVSAEYDYINLGDYVLIQSNPHGINQYVELTAMDIDLLDPANDTLTFGADSASLTDAQRSSDRNVQTALESLSVRYTNLVATAITTEYLTTNYLTANDIAALYVKADSLEVEVAAFGYLTASDANLTYATISDLTTATANITDLSADVANITTILAGNIGTGNLQTVHLTGENVVIDDAVITSAMIADLSASKLTTGTIYTDKVTIQSESGNLYITDNTIQIQDGATVRVQIGEDASGDYNLYLWDAAGNLLWDAGGLYAAGIHDGIIRDIAVADDAAISGTKLDIASVAECLNEDGSLTVDAANITIDNTTLDVAYTTITSNTAAAQSAAAEAQAAAQAVQSTADDAASAAATAASDAATAQSTANSASAAAANAQAAANTAQADATAAQSAADAAQATADQAASDLAQAQADLKTAQDNYTALAEQADATDEELAAAQKAIADAQSAVDTAQATADAASTAAANAQTAANAAQADATAAQTAADTAATAAAEAQSTADTAKADAATAQEAADAAQATADDAAAAAAELNTRTTTLETELAVVQGQIAAKVWQTDITDITDPLGEQVTTLEDQYAQLTLDLNSITLSVGDLTTTVTDQGTSITEITGELSLKVDKDDNEQIVSMINASANEICITGDRLVIESTNFTLTAEGKITCTEGEFSGKITATAGTIGGWAIGETMLSTSVTIDENTYKYYLQAADFDSTYSAFGIQCTDSDGNVTYPFRVGYNGAIDGRQLLASYRVAASTSADVADAATGVIMDATGWVALKHSGTPSIYFLPNGMSSTDSAPTLSGRVDASVPGFQFNGAIFASNDVKIGNNNGFYVRDTDGTLTLIGMVDSSNRVLLGATTRATYLRGTNIYAGPKLLRVPEIQRNEVSITPSAANTPTGIAVEFDTAFSGTPAVMVTPVSSTPGKEVTGVSSYGTSTTGVTIYVTRTNTTTTGVKWVAVY